MVRYGAVPHEGIHHDRGSHDVRPGVPGGFGQRLTRARFGRQVNHQSRSDVRQHPIPYVGVAHIGYPQIDLRWELSRSALPRMDLVQETVHSHDPKRQGRQVGSQRAADETCPARHDHPRRSGPFHLPLANLSQCTIATPPKRASRSTVVHAFGATGRPAADLACRHHCRAPRSDDCRSPIRWRRSPLGLAPSPAFHTTDDPLHHGRQRGSPLVLGEHETPARVGQLGAVGGRLEQARHCRGEVVQIGHFEVSARHGGQTLQGDGRDDRGQTQGLVLQHLVLHTGPQSHGCDTDAGPTRGCRHIGYLARDLDPGQGTQYGRLVCRNPADDPQTRFGASQSDVRHDVDSHPVGRVEVLQAAQVADEDGDRLGSDLGGSEGHTLQVDAVGTHQDLPAGLLVAEEIPPVHVADQERSFVRGRDPPFERPQAPVLQGIDPYPASSPVLDVSLRTRW